MKLISQRKYASVLLFDLFCLITMPFQTRIIFVKNNNRRYSSMVFFHLLLNTFDFGSVREFGQSYELALQKI